MNVQNAGKYSCKSVEGANEMTSDEKDVEVICILIYVFVVVITIYNNS